jgi:hypothetical protein
MLEPVLTAPIFAVHGLLDGARGKGLVHLSILSLKNTTKTF